MKLKQSLEDSQADVRKLEAAAAVCARLVSTQICLRVVLTQAARQTSCASP